MHNRCLQRFGCCFQPRWTSCWGKRVIKWWCVCPTVAYAKIKSPTPWELNSLHQNLYINQLWKEKWVWLACNCICPNNVDKAWGLYLFKSSSASSPDFIVKQLKQLGSWDAGLFCIHCCQCRIHFRKCNITPFKKVIAQQRRMMDGDGTVGCRGNREFENDMLFHVAFHLII